MLYKVGVCFAVFQEVLNLAASEFKDDLTTVGPDGSLIPRNTSWNGLRFMITEVS